MTGFLIQLQNRFDQGYVQKSDLLNGEVRLRETEAQLSSASATIEAYSDELSLWMGKALDDQYAMESIPVESPDVPITTLPEDRPDFRALNVTVSVYDDWMKATRRSSLLLPVQIFKKRTDWLLRRLRRREAAAAVAEKHYERYKILHQQHSTTDKELENVTLQYQVARAQVQSARRMQQEVGASTRYAQVVTPFTVARSRKNGWTRVVWQVWVRC